MRAGTRPRRSQPASGSLAGDSLPCLPPSLPPTAPPQPRPPASQPAPSHLGHREERQHGGVGQAQQGEEAGQAGHDVQHGDHAAGEHRLAPRRQAVHHRCAGGQDEGGCTVRSSERQARGVPSWRASAAWQAVLCWPSSPPAGPCSCTPQPHAPRALFSCAAALTATSLACASDTPSFSSRGTGMGALQGRGRRAAAAAGEMSREPAALQGATACWRRASAGGVCARTRRGGPSRTAALPPCRRRRAYRRPSHQACLLAPKC